MPRAATPRQIRNRTRLLFVIVASLAAIATTLIHRPTSAAATAAEESAFVTALNQVRAENGLPGLTVNTELSNLSRGHAQVMADAGEIFHASPISEGYTGAWSKFGALWSERILRRDKYEITRSGKHTRHQGNCVCR